MHEVTILNYFLPKISIIIPVYNGSNYVKEAIESALSQTYKNIEVIVVNDGSSDNGETEKIALSYGDKIRYFKKENGGVSSALNFGIEKMKGEYFSWLSHDDKYEPQKIEQQVKLLSKENKKLIVLCSDAKIDKDSNLLNYNYNHRFQENRIYDSKEVLKNILEKGSFNGCALLIPKTVFNEVGIFDVSFRYIQDVLMWINIFLNDYSLVYTPRPLSLMRIHNAQLTQTGRQLFYKESLEMCQYIIEMLNKKSDSTYNFVYYFAKHNAVLGNKCVVKYCCQYAKSQHIFKYHQKLAIWGAYIYGSIRPLIRKLYYKLILRVKTQ